MNTKQYQKELLKACSREKLEEQHLRNMNIDISNHIEELHEASKEWNDNKIKEKIGDLFFYLVNTFSFLDIEIDNISYLIPPSKNYIEELHKIKEDIKNELENFINKGKKITVDNLTTLHLTLMELVTRCDFDASEILKNNLKKQKNERTIK